MNNWDNWRIYTIEYRGHLPTRYFCKTHYSCDFVPRGETTPADRLTWKEAHRWKAALIDDDMYESYDLVCMPHSRHGKPRAIMSEDTPTSAAIAAGRID